MHEECSKSLIPTGASTRSSPIGISDQSLSPATHDLKRQPHISTPPKDVQPIVIHCGARASQAGHMRAHCEREKDTERENRTPQEETSMSLLNHHHARCSPLVVLITSVLRCAPARSTACQCTLLISPQQPRAVATARTAVWPNLADYTRR